jgi:lactate permease
VSKRKLIGLRYEAQFLNFLIPSNPICFSFDPIDALTYTLIFDTTPVAFGALGIPVTTLAALTGLPVKALSQMIGRQLPFISLFLPTYALLFYAGWRDGFLACWPAGAVAGISFAVTQVCKNVKQYMAQRHYL